MDQTVMASLAPINHGIVWIGFLFRQINGSRPTFGFAVLNVSAGNGVPEPGYGILYVGGGVFGIDNDFGGQRALTSIASSGMTSCLVVKLNFDTGEQDLFVNPGNAWAAPDATLAMTPDFRATGFSQLLLHEGLNTDGDTFIFDELRVGTTFADIRTGW